MNANTLWLVIIVSWSALMLAVLYACRAQFRFYRKLAGGVWYLVEQNHELVWTRNKTDGRHVRTEA